MKKLILVGSDGTPAARGALRMAHLLADRWQAPVEVVAVLEPFPVYGTGSTDAMVQSRRQLELAGEVALHNRVHAQLSEMGPHLAAWPIGLHVGQPAPTIARVAAEKGASIILLGIGRHALPDRWFGSETALRVIRMAHVPVLSVHTDASLLPQRAVIGVDFTEFSRDAARAALQLLAPEGVLHLAHVLWKPAPETPWVGGMDWIEEYRRSMPPRLEEFARELDGIDTARLATHLLEGDPASELLRLAEEVNAELIAVGSHGTGFLGRILMGSVSTRVVRGSRCSVLVAPLATLPAEVVGTRTESREETEVAAGAESAVPGGSGAGRP